MTDKKTDAAKPADKRLGATVKHAATPAAALVVKTAALATPGQATVKARPPAKAVKPAVDGNKPAERFAARLSGMPADKPVARPAGRFVDKPADKPAAKTVTKAANGKADREHNEQGDAAGHFQQKPGVVAGIGFFGGGSPALVAGGVRALVRRFLG